MIHAIEKGEILEISILITVIGSFRNERHVVAIEDPLEVRARLARGSINTALSA